MASYNATTFIGYTGSVFSRFYFSSINKSGWFLEAKGSYAYFTTKGYSDYYYDNVYSTFPTLYNENNEDVNYIYAAASGGYKVLLSKRFSFECLTGLHFGKATFGKNYTNVYNDNPSSMFFGETANVKDFFYESGPGFPFHIMINFGFVF